MRRRVMTTAAPPKFVSLANGAQIMGVSVDTLRRRIRTGDLPAVRDGRRLIRVRVDDLVGLFRPVPTFTTKRTLHS